MIRKRQKSKRKTQYVIWGKNALKTNKIDKGKKGW